MHGPGLAIVDARRVDLTRPECFDLDQDIQVARLHLGATPGTASRSCSLPHSEPQWHGFAIIGSEADFGSQHSEHKVGLWGYDEPPGARRQRNAFLSDVPGDVPKESANRLRRPF